MEDGSKKPRRNSVAQFKLNNIRDSVKCSLSIQPFSAGVRPQKVSCKDPIFENEHEHTPEKFIQSKNFFNFYEEIKYIGQGGQSVIKKVRRKADNKVFAVKIYKIKSFEDSESVNSILKEFLNSKALNHHNIMKVYEVFTDEVKNEVRIVTEYLKLKTLDHFIKKKHVFSEKEVSIITFQILNALFYMHSKGICHRDINSTNIMIDKEVTTLKIIDFGISKNFSEIFRKNRKFVRKSVSMWSSVGTLSYSAPEMFLGDGYCNDVDLWSLGILTYQLLFGILPFYSEYSGTLIELIINCKVEFPKTINVSSLAKEFCKKLLRKSAEGRFNAEEALRHPYILVYNNTIQTLKELKDRTVNINHECSSPQIIRKVEKFRSQIFKKLASYSVKKEKKKNDNNVLIKSLKKFSTYNPSKKNPIMKIKNFPPFILEKNVKNLETMRLSAFKSSLSIEECLDEKFKSKEEFDDNIKKIFEKSEESTNLITSNLL